jgi:hypothetical protein
MRVLLAAQRVSRLHSGHLVTRPYDADESVSESDAPAIARAQRPQSAHFTSMSIRMILPLGRLWVVSRSEE